MNESQRNINLQTKGKVRIIRYRKCIVATMSSDVAERNPVVNRFVE